MEDDAGELPLRRSLGTIECDASQWEPLDRAMITRFFCSSRCWSTPHRDVSLPPTIASAVLKSIHGIQRPGPDAEMGTTLGSTDDPLRDEVRETRSRWASILNLTLGETHMQMPIPLLITVHDKSTTHTRRRKVQNSLACRPAHLLVQRVDDV